MDGARVLDVSNLLEPVRRLEFRYRPLGDLLLGQDSLSGLGPGRVLPEEAGTGVSDGESSIRTQ